MLSYTGRRLLYGLVVVWVAVTMLFLVTRVLPGDPALLILGPSASTEQVEAFQERLGLNEPIWSQYVDYMSDAARGDFGESIRLGSPAMDLVMGRLTASLILAFSATFIAVAVGIPLGVAAARKPGSIRDRIISTTVLIGQSIPPFWLGIVMIILFARNLGWFPSSSPDVTFRSVVLPAVALASPFTAIVARLARGGMLEVISSEYIDTARSKGISERRTIYRHALPNMLIPVVTIVGLQFGALIGGAVIVETVFAWPGVGRLMIDAINNRDYAVVQASAAVLAIMFIVLNLIVDLLYAALDPRIRLSGGVVA